MKAVKWWILIAYLLYEVHRKRDLNAVLIVAPADRNATVGSHVRLSCSTDAGKEVNWQYGEDLNSVTDIYIANEGMGREYRKSARYKIDINTTSGQYDLLIRNITMEDSGFYICSEPGSWGTPPHARLSVTGGELPAKVCRENVIATKGSDLGLAFSTCNPKPQYLSHAPVGRSHSNDVYNLGKLLNNYAYSGRFTVNVAKEGLKLWITNIQMSDAGTYTCIGDSGHGERHNQELVVLDELPTCTDNTSDTQCIKTANETTEVTCAVNYTGNCAPHSIWKHKYGHQSSFEVQQVFTDLTKTLSRAEMKAIIEIGSGSWLICSIESPFSDGMHKFQCNTSTAPEQCKEQQNNTSSSPSATNTPTNKQILIAVACVATILLVILAACIIRVLKRRRQQKSHSGLNSMTSLQTCDVVLNQELLMTNANKEL